jgi:outer membrane protein
VHLAAGLIAALLAVQDPLPAPPVPTAPPPAPAVVPLARLVHEALQLNLTLRSLRETTRSVETAIGSARSAFDPRIAVAPSYTRGGPRLLVEPGLLLTDSQNTGVFGSSVSGSLPTSTNYSLNLDSNWLDQASILRPPGGLNPIVNTTLSFTVAQPLLRGRGSSIARAPVRQAELAAESADARLGRFTEQTIADVETAYWSLGLAEAVERLSRDSLERAREVLSRNERMLALALTAEVDVITSRRGVQQRLTSLTDAVRRRADAYERLVFLVYGERAPALVGVQPWILTEPPPDDYQGPMPGAAQLEETAVASRRDVQAARLDLAQNEIGTKVAKNALLPDVSLSATYSALALNTDSLRIFDTARVGDIDQRDWLVGVSFSYPVGNRAARSAYARARYDTAAAALALDSADAQTRAEVRAAARAIASDRERLGQAALSLKYAREQYAAGEKQLQLGLLDSFRLLQMEEDVANADLVYEQTRYELALSIASFELALGTIDRKYGVLPGGETGG